MDKAGIPKINTKKSQNTTSASNSLKCFIMTVSWFSHEYENFRMKKWSLKPGLGLPWFAFHFDSLLIRNRINQWFANEWITIHLPLILDSIWFLIRRWIIIREWIVIRDESKSNRMKMNKIEINHISKWITNSNELWIEVNQNESESKMKWFA